MGSRDLVTGISYSPGVWASGAGLMAQPPDATGPCSCQSCRKWKEIHIQADIWLTGCFGYSVTIHLWCTSMHQLLWKKFHAARFCMTSCLQISFNMVSHNAHIWGSDKYFTPTEASLSFSSSPLFIIFVLHMCQRDSPSVLVLVHLFPLTSISLSLKRGLWML